MVKPCEICHGKRFGRMMCLFTDDSGNDIGIHPACGKDPTHPLHMLSSNQLRQRFGNKAAVRRVFESGSVRSACGPWRFGNQSEMYIVAEFVAALSEEGYFAAEAAKKKKGPSDPYLARVFEGTEATSLEELKELGHLNKNCRLGGKNSSLAYNVKKSCRAYRAGFLVEHPKKRGFRGAPIFQLSPEFKKVRVRNPKKKAKKASASSSASSSSSSTVERPFQCPECDKCYTNNLGLYQHRYNKHGFRAGSNAGRKRKRDD